MNKLAKGFLFAVAGVVVLTCVAVLGINLYVESIGVQTRLENALSNELKMEVKLTRMRFSLWDGLRVLGLTVPDPTVDPEENNGKPVYFMEAPRISARIAVMPLFSRRLVVRELVIDSPVVTWRQTRKGRWELPRLQPEADSEEAHTAAKKKKRKKRERERDRERALAAAGEDQAAPAPLKATPQAVPAPQGTPTPQAEPPPPGKKPLEFRIVAARMDNARFHFLDRKGRPLAVFEGVTLNCPVAAKHEARGSAVIRRVILQESVTILHVVTTFEYVDGTLSLPQLDARLAGGNLSGSFFLYPLKSLAPFVLDLKFDRVDLQSLLDELGSDEAMQQSHGKLNGYLHLEGRAGRSRTFHGSGHLRLDEGRMEHYPLLQSIGMVLQIEELTRLELERAQLHFWIGGGRVHIDDLALVSSNLSLTAKGESRFDGKLSLDAGLAIAPKISRQLPGWIHSNFVPVEGSDQKQIRFGISGTLEHPETDLMRVMVGEKIEKQALDLFKAFRSLTGGSRKKRSSKDDAKEQATPPASSEDEDEEAAASQP